MRRVRVMAGRRVMAAPLGVELRRYRCCPRCARRNSPTDRAAAAAWRRAPAGRGARPAARAGRRPDRSGCAPGSAAGLVAAILGAAVRQMERGARHQPDMAADRGEGLGSPIGDIAAVGGAVIAVAQHRVARQVEQSERHVVVAGPQDAALGHAAHLVPGALLPRPGRAGVARGGSSPPARRCRATRCDGTRSRADRRT